MAHCIAVRVRERYTSFYKGNQVFETTNTSALDILQNGLMFEVCLDNDGFEDGDCFVDGLRAGADSVPQASQFTRALGESIEQAEVPDSQMVTDFHPATAASMGAEGAPGPQDVAPGGEELPDDGVAAEADIPICEGRQSAAMQAALALRRRIKGAESSGERFNEKWAAVALKCQKLSPSAASPISNPSGVIPDTDRLFAVVRQQYNETWDDNTKRLGVAALTLYRSRQTDIGMIMFVRLLWIVLGGRHLRAHGGRAYFYDSVIGHFDAFDGLLPAEILSVTSSFMLTLEGIFRALPETTTREDNALLVGIDNAMKAALDAVAEADPEKKMRVALLSFHDHCVFNSGNARLRRAMEGGDAPAGAADQGQVGGDQEVRDQKSAWTVLTAQTISKILPKIQVEMLGTKLLTYFTEWCETASPRRPGVAFLDCVYHYDVNDVNVTFARSRSPENNIYLGIRANLLSGRDPVLEAATQRVQMMYERTFWSIPEAFVSTLIDIVIALARFSETSRCAWVLWRACLYMREESEIVFGVRGCVCMCVCAFACARRSLSPSWCAIVCGDVCKILL